MNYYGKLAKSKKKQQQKTHKKTNKQESAVGKVLSIGSFAVGEQSDRAFTVLGYCEVG
jgi:hypothetical protein